MAKKTRRFGTHEVTSGQFKGGLHVATPAYQKFSAELHYLHDYLNRRLLLIEPEETAMQGILMNLHNLLEHESEGAIRRYVESHGTKKEAQFQQKIQQGYVSFKSKCDWLRTRSIISEGDYSVMEEVRGLRNDYAHSRPRSKRRKLCYRGYPLLTKKSIRRMFVEVELVLRVIRRQSRRRSVWATVPPGYASEMNWPDDYVKALDRKIMTRK